MVVEVNRKGHDVATAEAFFLMTISAFGFASGLVEGVFPLLDPTLNGFARLSAREPVCCTYCISAIARTT